MYLYTVLLFVCTSQYWKIKEFFYLVSPSAFAIWPNMWANEFGMIPLSSGTARTPSMVKVLPVPVCPYAKIVPENNEEKQWFFKV